MGNKCIWIAVYKHECNTESTDIVKNARYPRCVRAEHGAIWTSLDAGSGFLNDFKFRFVSPTRLEGVDISYFWIPKGSWNSGKCYLH